MLSTKFDAVRALTVWCTILLDMPGVRNLDCQPIITLDFIMWWETKKDGQSNELPRSDLYFRRIIQVAVGQLEGQRD